MKSISEFLLNNDFGSFLSLCSFPFIWENSHCDLSIFYSQQTLHRFIIFLGNPNLFISVYSITSASAMPHISAVSTSTCYSVSSLLPPFFSSSCCCMLTCFSTSYCLPQFPHSFHEVHQIFPTEFYAENVNKLSTMEILALDLAERAFLCEEMKLQHLKII